MPVNSVDAKKAQQVAAAAAAEVNRLLHRSTIQIQEDRKTVVPNITANGRRQSENVRKRNEAHLPLHAGNTPRDSPKSFLILYLRETALTVLQRHTSIYNHHNYRGPIKSIDDGFLDL